MKPWSTILLNNYLRPTTSLAMAWRVKRADHQVFGWTDHDEDVVLDGVTYRASGGLGVTAAHTTDTLAVPTLDITAFLDVSTEFELEAGYWDNSIVTMFEFCWDPLPLVMNQHTVNIIRHGQLGTVRRENTRFTAELRGETQRLNKRIGRQYTPTCPWRFGSVECGLDITPWTSGGGVTALGSDPALVFQTSDVKPDGYFAGGWVTFATGANAGLTREVRSFVAQYFGLWRPFPSPVAIGDAYTGVHGDDKRFETCRDVFNNSINFGGFPDIPGSDKIYSNVTGY